MNESSSPDLLGYLAGALEPVEHQEIETLVKQDSELRDELRRLREQLQPLDNLQPPGAAPAGLARRTCEHVAGQSSISSSSFDSRAADFGTESLDEIVDDAMANLPPAIPVKLNTSAPSPFQNAARSRKMSPLIDAPSGRRKSVMDFIIVAVVLMLLAAIVLPAINNSRFESRMLSCQENLRTVGTGLLDYAAANNGSLIEIPREGNLAFAGMQAVTLYQDGFVNDVSNFHCAGSGKAQPLLHPSLQEINEASGTTLYKIQRNAGGDYAYSLGVQNENAYVPGKVQNRSNYVLLADVPSVERPGRGSNNHSGRGQNVFLENGQIRFLSSPKIGEDSIYENDWGTVAPGSNVLDSVVAPSGTRLIPIGISYSE